MMLDAAVPRSALGGDSLSRLVRAGLLTAITDGIFACALSVFAYGSTVVRLWQGVASTLLGKEAFEGGTATAMVGVLMHIGVAFGWSAVFIFLVLRSRWVRDLLASSYGPAKVGFSARPIHLERHVPRRHSAPGAPPAHDRGPLVGSADRSYPIRGNSDRGREPRISSSRGLAVMSTICSRCSPRANSGCGHRNSCLMA